jgi:hypothetical protein
MLPTENKSNVRTWRIPAALGDPGECRHMIAVRCKADALFSASSNSKQKIAVLGSLDDCGAQRIGKS